MNFKFNDGRDWFFSHRFGLFVHWGLYAIPAWHEQMQWRARMSRADVAKLADQWNPSAFNPDHWIDVAESTGMRYLCFTVKHHDGFCLWNTRETDFNCMNTPYGKDILKQLAEACERRSFPLCLYYSCVDWRHPNYPNQGRHHELPRPLDGDVPDHGKYLDFVKAQVRELCTDYGVIHGFWWDMNVEEHVDPSVNSIIRELQPHAVINNRGYDEGDFSTPERDFDSYGKTTPNQPIEACQSVGMESWGYRKNEDYYAHRHLMGGIDKYLALGGNYLLNVGPMETGALPFQALESLRVIGEWYHSVKESFEDTTFEPQISRNSTVLITRKENVLYVHLNCPPIGDGVKLAPLTLKPVKATLLNTGEPVSFAVEFLPSDHMEQKTCLRLTHLPVNTTSQTVMVIKLEFDDLPDLVIDPGLSEAADEIFIR